ncbi:hypothetical protein LINGRAHAP2_LOCUS20985, partial [Linum grandiflorum]
MDLLIGLLIYGLRVFVAAAIFHTICEMRRLDLSTFSWIVILAGFVAMSHLSTEWVNSWLQRRRARIWRGEERNDSSD